MAPGGVYVRRRVRISRLSAFNITESARPEAEILSRRSRGRLGAGGRPRDACTIGIVDAGRGCAQSFHRLNGMSSRGLGAGMLKASG